MNKEKLRAYHKKHYLLHKEKYNKRDREWYKKNKEIKDTKVKKWKEMHPENIKRWKARYYEKHKERVRLLRRMCRARRRALQKSAKGTFTLKEWEELLRKTSFTCQKCRKKEPEVKMTIDHIIPLSRGGTNYIGNIQPLCMRCNCSKGTFA